MFFAAKESSLISASFPHPINLQNETKLSDQLNDNQIIYDRVVSMQA